jgi:predicted component of type VI protein secretion system
MSGRLDFEYGFNHKNAQPTQSDTPMRLYFLGDFSGAQSAIESNTINKIVKIDVDNFDEVMTKLRPSVDLPSGQQLIFRELEDFHPDNLFEQRIFKTAERELRRQQEFDAVVINETVEEAGQSIVDLVLASQRAQATKE